MIAGGWVALLVLRYLPPNTASFVLRIIISSCQGSPLFRRVKDLPNTASFVLRITIWSFKNILRMFRRVFEKVFNSDFEKEIIKYIVL